MELDRLTQMNGRLTIRATAEQFEMHRVDLYTKPARWFWQQAEEVEIWALPDGREVRASRQGTSDWTVEWREPR